MALLLVNVCALTDYTNSLPTTLNILHLGSSYHMHPSHQFLTWGAVRLKKLNVSKNFLQYQSAFQSSNLIGCVRVY